MLTKKATFNNTEHLNAISKNKKTIWQHLLMKSVSWAISFQNQMFLHTLYLIPSQCKRGKYPYRITWTILGRKTMQNLLWHMRKNSTGKCGEQKPTGETQFLFQGEKRRKSFIQQETVPPMEPTTSCSPACGYLGEQPPLPPVSTSGVLCFSTSGRCG